MRLGRPRREAAGFTYIGLLCAVALLGIGLLAASEVWVTTMRREQMAQLEWVGGQYVQAIGSYYESSPGGAKSFPPSISALLEDRRFLTMKRHLRQRYRNPFPGHAEWEPVFHASGGIVGIRASLPLLGDGGKSWKEYRYQPHGQW